MDVMMPEMDGMTAMAVIKKINPEVKAIVTSGLRSTDKIAAAKKAGIDTFLPKPYTAEQLILTLHEALA